MLMLSLVLVLVLVLVLSLSLSLLLMLMLLLLLRLLLLLLLRLLLLLLLLLFFVGELGTTYLETRLANGEASHNLHHRTPELGTVRRRSKIAIWRESTDVIEQERKRVRDHQKAGEWSES